MGCAVVGGNFFGKLSVWSSQDLNFVFLDQKAIKKSFEQNLEHET